MSKRIISGSHAPSFIPIERGLCPSCRFVTWSMGLSESCPMCSYDPLKIKERQKEFQRKWRLMQEEGTKRASKIQEGNTHSKGGGWKARFHGKDTTEY